MKNWSKPEIVSLDLNKTECLFPWFHWSFDWSWIIPNRPNSPSVPSTPSIPSTPLTPATPIIPTIPTTPVSVTDLNS